MTATDLTPEGIELNADINMTGEDWVQVTLSGQGADRLTEQQIEAAFTPAPTDSAALVGRLKEHHNDLIGSDVGQFVMDDILAAAAALSSRAAAPTPATVVEPVAWLAKSPILGMQWLRERKPNEKQIAARGMTVAPLYAHPPAADFTIPPEDDGRPCSMDVFVGQLFEDCDDHYDRGDAIKHWLEGSWDEALEYLDDPAALAKHKDNTHE